MIVLQQLLEDILGQLQKLVDVLEQGSMVVGRYEVLSLAKLHHESIHAEGDSANEVLLAIYELNEVSPTKTVGVLLG